MTQARREFVYDDHRFQLHQTDGHITLQRDGEAILTGSVPAIRLLGRHILAMTRVRPENSGKRWSQVEDEHLRTHFRSPDQLRVLAAHHQRSERAIEARLVRLGLIEDAPHLRFRVVPKSP